ncbi:hypothetical protein [Winogradskyella sp. J14-2]|nr:hypothetical protein [Winogradskyella sp. J14-2]
MLEQLENNHEIDRDKLIDFGKYCLNIGVKTVYVTIDSDSDALL